MNIGVDAFYLSNQNNDGIGNYLLQLLTAVSKIDQSNNYFLYTPYILQSTVSEEIARNPNFHIVIIPGIFKKRRRFWLQSPSLLARCKADNVDIFFGGGEYFPLLLPRKIKVMITIHDVAFKIIPEAISITNRLFYYLLFPLFLRRSDLILTVSNNSKNEIIRYLNISENKVNVIYNGIEIAIFRPGPNIKKKDYILFVGTLQPRKNLVNLIKAFALIAPTINENLIIVGARSWQNSQIKDVVHSLPDRIQNRIEFKGYVSGEELRALYKTAKLFTLLSLHEGFGFPILEAMASGTAVVTAKSAAIPEVFLDAVEYADPFSPDDIAQKIQHLIADNDKRKIMEKNGLRYAWKYDVSVQGNAFLSVINALDKRNSRNP